jgi:hypothetical protein
LVNAAPGVPPAKLANSSNVACLAEGLELLVGGLRLHKERPDSFGTDTGVEEMSGEISSSGLWSWPLLGCDRERRSPTIEVTFRSARREVSKAKTHWFLGQVFRPVRIQQSLESRLDGGIGDAGIRLDRRTRRCER